MGQQDGKGPQRPGSRGTHPQARVRGARRRRRGHDGRGDPESPARDRAARGSSASDREGASATPDDCALGEGRARDARSVSLSKAWTSALDRFTDGVDRKSTRLNSSHVAISYAVFCLKKKMKYLYVI